LNDGRKDEPIVSVIVPTVNGAGVLADLLASLEQQTLSHEVVVVDNGSTDSTRTLLKERFPGVRLVALPRNIGFGRAVNRGVRASSGRILVFLNNDVVCEPTFLERLCAVISPGEGVVMAAGVLLQAGDPALIDTAGIEVDPTLLAFDHLHGERITKLDSAVRHPIGPCAGAAAFDRTAFEAVRGFDEHMFAYLEDADLALRLALNGGRCRVARDARAVHRLSSTLGPRSAAKAELVAWGRGYLLGKYRLNRRPALFARAVVGEVLDVVGRLLLDRNLVGLRARLAGFSAGLQTARADIPPQTQRYSVSFFESQRRRLSRRLGQLQKVG
jgi:GT2 family glycosyltransferase